MGWGEYARSKVPLKLVFLLMAAVLVNSLILEGVKLLTQFRYDRPTDVAALAQMNAEYENCTILDTKEYSEKEHTLWGMDYTAFLLETENGNIKIAVVGKHLLFDRYRYFEKFSANIPVQKGVNAVTKGNSFQQAVFWLNNSTSIDDFNVSQNYGPSYSLAIIPMIIVEYLAYCFLFKREELLVLQ